MTLWSYILDARNTIISNKLRSGLSSLGIIIGVSSVVILLSIGAGTKAQLTESMGSMTTNSVTITASNNDSSNTAKDLPLNSQTLFFLETTFSELSGQVSTIAASNQTISYGTTSTTSTVNGISPNYFDLSKQEFIYGTGFSEKEYTNGNSIVILNYGSLETLFDDANPVGQVIKLKGKNFTVIGVLDQTTMESMGRSSVTAYIPFTTLNNQITLTKEYDSMVVYLPNEADNETWKQIIHYSLLRYIGVNTTAAGNFSVTSFASFVETLQSTISMFTYFLAAIGGISLLVGGIGVMNIMIVSVTERTREIGIRKAIGALKKDIIMQFLTESVVITFLGGLIAVLFSYSVVYGINALLAMMSSGGNTMFSNLRLSITADVVLLAFSLTTITGIAFGILPAQKAVKLKVIDALRFE